MECDRAADWTGRTLRQLDLRNKRHLNVAAVRAEGEHMKKC